MNKAILLLGALLSLIAINSTAGQNLAPWQEMKKIGSAKLKVAFWDIYHAELFADQSAFDPQQPFALKITYLRQFDKEALIKETVKQWEKLGSVDDARMEQWSFELTKVLADVNKNDSLTFFTDAAMTAHFYLNSKYLGRVDDPGFAQQFSAIWLSPKTSRPKMRQQLLGDV